MSRISLATLKITLFLNVQMDHATLNFFQETYKKFVISTSTIPEDSIYSTKWELPSVGIRKTSNRRPDLSRAWRIDKNMIHVFKITGWTISIDKGIRPLLSFQANYLILAIKFNLQIRFNLFLFAKTSKQIIRFQL